MQPEICIVLDIMTILNRLTRPRLLMRAARIGADDYRREVHLPRLLGCGALPRQTQALLRLVEIESVLSSQRIEEDSAYNLLRHIDVLIAIVGETRILQAAKSTA